MEQEQKAKVEEQKFLSQIHYLTSLLKKNQMTMGDNLEKVKDNLTPKGLNPESPDKFAEKSHTEIENLKSQLAESEAQKLECIEDEIALHKKH